MWGGDSTAHAQIKRVRIYNQTDFEVQFDLNTANGEEWGNRVTAIENYIYKVHPIKKGQYWDFPYEDSIKYWNLILMFPVGNVYFKNIDLSNTREINVYSKGSSKSYEDAKFYIVKS